MCSPKWPPLTKTRPCVGSASYTIEHTQRIEVDASFGTCGDQKTAAVVIPNCAYRPDWEQRIEARKIESHIVRRAPSLKFAGNYLRQGFLLRPVTDQLVVVNKPSARTNDAASDHLSTLLGESGR